MRKTGIYTYFAFGYDYYILKDGCPGRRARGGDDSLDGMITQFFEWLAELHLPVTQNAAEPLTDIQAELQKLPLNATVDGSLAKRVQQACQRLDGSLNSELELRYAYVVTPKRFDLEHLLDSPQQLLATSTWEQLPPLVKFDFSQAARCIAFGVPTAAVFHLMRSVEGMLRHYYCSIVKRGRIEPLLWNGIITQLRAKRGGPPRALLDHLDNIRVNFRNPTQHPEARYSLDEAQDLMAVAVDALNRMVRDLQSRTPGKKTA